MFKCPKCGKEKTPNDPICECDATKHRVSKHWTEKPDVTEFAEFLDSLYREYHNNLDRMSMIGIGKLSEVIVEKADTVIRELQELDKKPKRPIGNLLREYDEKLPEPQLNRIIKEGGTTKKCPKCGSSMHTKWIGIIPRGTDGCIHPKCENYYKKEK